MQTINYKNYTIQVDQDTDPISPNDWDTLGTIVTQSGYLGTKMDSKKIEQILERDDIIWLPIYTFEHSGIRVNTTGFNCQWDSWQDGIIYVTKAKAKKEFKKRNTEEKKVLDVLKSEIQAWDDYLSGNVHGYQIFDSQHEEIDSCWGYYGDIDYCIQEAKSYIDSIIPNSIKLLKKFKTKFNLLCPVGSQSSEL